MAFRYYRVVVVKWLQSLKKPGFYTNLKGFADPNTPYITAEFSADYFGGKSEIDFVIGDGTTTSRTKTTSRVRRATTQGMNFIIAVHIRTSIKVHLYTVVARK